MCSVLKRSGYGNGFRWLAQYINWWDISLPAYLFQIYYYCCQYYYYYLIGCLFSIYIIIILLLLMDFWPQFIIIIHTGWGLYHHHRHHCLHRVGFRIIITPCSTLMVVGISSPRFWVRRTSQRHSDRQRPLLGNIVDDKTPVLCQLLLFSNL